ncbi:MAG TPA: hypothetical protein VKN35_15310, partial [Xanthomonadales bacterium]|nr:hypothetical protein [Xanthomonadales bacterium]
MRRRNKIFLFLPALLVLGLAALAWSFLHTAPGAHWAWSQAVKNVPGSLKAASMAGDLRSGLVLNQVAYADENVHAEVNHLEIRLAFDLFPPAISIESLEIGQARLILLENRSETKPGSTADTIAGLALPLPISFRQVQIDELSVLDADETELLELNAMSLEGDWYQSLDLRKAGFQSGELAWVFDGSLELGAPFLLYARLDTHVPAGGGGLDFPADLNIESRMKGNLSEAEITVNTDLGGISVRGQLHDLLADPGWELRLLSDSMDWPPGSSAPDLSLQNIQADISGWITDYELLASAQADTADLPQAEVHLEARGNLDGLQINELNASSDLLSLKASGPLSWLDEFNFVFGTNIESFNPGFWVEDWPGDSPASGTLAVTWAGNRLSLDKLDIGVANSELRITGSVAYKAGQDSIEGRLSWTSLKWPIGARQADFESPVGQVSLDGQLENWTASGSLELKSGDWPRGLIQATASGTQESVRIEVEEGQVLGGRFAGQFNYQWTDGQPWSARINASNLDVSSMAFAMAEGLTGVLNAKLEASGQTNPLAFSVDIKQLDGQINGQPLRADGSLVMDSGALKANALSVRSGNSRVLINGNAHQEEGMRFSGAIESLADFF